MQTLLFNNIPLNKAEKNKTEWGTFRDSLKAPVHSWFTYPAGFSYKAVEHSIKSNKVKPGQLVYDPFMGSGTTNIVSKILGINSQGIEAHPFVYEITKTKMNWSINKKSVRNYLEKIREATIEQKNENENEILEILKEEFPKLILKCFLPQTLHELLIIRNTIFKCKNKDVKNFLKTGLICTLRSVSIAATGWPYIAPNKIKITSMSKKGFETYYIRIEKMLSDISELKKQQGEKKSNHDIRLGDSRDSGFESESADHIFTSPPYLNNFDYADRTRLELYFMGEAKCWKDISKNVRTKLMTSATTQISRTDPKYTFREGFRNECPKVLEFLDNAVFQLSEKRKVKGGKKSYDLMVLGYFNDIYQILKDNYRILKPNSKALYILGDSAPYGVHIPTDVLIGEIGKCIGFKNFSIELLRERGGKWKDNPQRHNVKLRETIVILEK